MRAEKVYESVRKLQMNYVVMKSHYIELDLERKKTKS